MRFMNRRTAIIAGVSALGGVGAYSLSKATATGNENGGKVGAALLAAEPVLGERWLGNQSAPVTMIEYASATCPHCARFHKNTFPLLKAEYIDTGKLRFAMREFPFDDLSLAAFMVARCAPEQRYFGMIDVLFERQKIWTRNNPKAELFNIAKLAGMSQKDFEACLSNETIAKGISESRDLARSKFGVTSTPTFFINGEKISGNQPMSQFRAIIDGLTS